jgi:hypothetical protein
MNRQQLRQKERENLKAYQEIKNLSPLALELVKGMVTGIEIKRIENQAKLEFVPVMHCLYANALNADYSFGKGRMNELIKAVNGQFEGLKNGTIDPRQVIDWCIAKEIDFTLEVEEDGKRESKAV